MDKRLRLALKNIILTLSYHFFCLIVKNDYLLRQKTKLKSFIYLVLVEFLTTQF